MDIKSIKLVNSGFKGFDAVILKEEEREGHKKINKKTERPRHPIHLGLEIPFKDLRYHLLQICQVINEDMRKDEVDALISECEVESVVIEPEHFVIKGIKHCFSEKMFPLTTPKVDSSDDYEHYDTVMKIIERIVEEAEHYLSGDVKVSDEEAAMRWIGAGKEKGVDMDAFNLMSPEEQKEFCSGILEKMYGATVLMPEDVEQGSADFTPDTEQGEQDEFVIDPSMESIKLPAK